MLHDVEHAAGALCRFEWHIFRRELPPHADHLAGFTGIGIQQVLKDRVRSPRHLGFRNSGVFVLHGHGSTSETKRGMKNRAPACYRTRESIRSFPASFSYSAFSALLFIKFFSSRSVSGIDLGQFHETCVEEQKWG